MVPPQTVTGGLLQLEENESRIDSKRLSGFGVGFGAADSKGLIGFGGKLLHPIKSFILKRLYQAAGSDKLKNRWQCEPFDEEKFLTIEA